MRTSIFHRIFHLGVILILCSVFFVSFRLQPDQKGFDTHRQLNLPPCVFLKLTGLPCPSCGMTTSFTLLAHGNIAGAFKANPAGPLLATAFLLLVCASIRALILNHRWNSVLDKKQFQSAAIFVIAIYMGIWIARILAITL